MQAMYTLQNITKYIYGITLDRTDGVFVCINLFELESNTSKFLMALF